jgi:hypothetical protein
MRRRSESEPDSQPEREEETLAMPRSPSRCHLLGIGFATSCAENLWGATIGGVSAFVWTGSPKGNAILLFWWFIVPAITWPYDFYWAFYHKVF